MGAQIFGEIGRGNLGIEGTNLGEGRPAVSQFAKGNVDLAPVLAIELEPGQIPVRGAPTGIAGFAVERCIGVEAHGQVFAVVAAPVKALDSGNEPLLLSAPAKAAGVGAQLEHGNLVGLGVAHQPFVGVEAVVAIAELPGQFVDCVGILQGGERVARACIRINGFGPAWSRSA